MVAAHVRAVVLTRFPFAFSPDHVRDAENTCELAGGGALQVPLSRALLAPDAPALGPIPLSQAARWAGK